MLASFIAKVEFLAKLFAAIAALLQAILKLFKAFEDMATAPTAA